MKTWTEKDVIIAVTGQIIGMLKNDIVECNGHELFQLWCERGDTFYNMYESEYGEDFCKACVNKMNAIQRQINELVYCELYFDI